MLAADDADKHFTVIDNRDKILLHGGFDKFFHGAADIDGFIVPATGNLIEPDVFGTFQIQGSMIFDIAEQIAFGECAKIHTLFI